MKKAVSLLKKIVPAVLLAVALAIMIPPSGVRMEFMISPHRSEEKLFSFFSFVPLRHGNFVPVVLVAVGLAPIILAALSFRFAVLRRFIAIGAGFNVVVSVAAWLVFDCFTPFWAAIAVLYAAAALLLFWSEKREERSTV